MIEIPLQNSNDVVVVQENDIIKNYQDVCHLIRNERASLSLYMKVFSVCYSESPDACLAALDSGLADARERRSSSMIFHFACIKLYYQIFKAAPNSDEAISLTEELKSLEQDFPDMTIQHQNQLLKVALSSSSKPPEVLLEQIHVLASEPKASESFYFVLSLLQGKLSFIRRDYRAALKAFQVCYRLRPFSILMIRISECWLELKIPHLAYQSACLAYSLNKCQNRALVSDFVRSLIISVLASAHSRHYIDAALDASVSTLKDGHGRNSCLELAATLLIGSVLFYKKDFESCLKLCQCALLKLQPSDASRSRFQFLIAQCHHSVGNFEASFAEYNSSLQTHAHNNPSRVGLFKLLLLRKDISAALDAYSKISTDSTLRPAVFLANFQRFMDNNDVAALNAARKSYVDLQIRDQLIHEVGKQLCLEPTPSTPAQNFYSRLRVPVPDSPSSNHQIAKFNTALQSGVIDDDSGNSEDFLCLRANLLMRQGKYHECSEIAKGMLEQDENNLNAWLILATSQYFQRALSPARKTVERILQKIDRHHFASLCLLANIHVEYVRSLRKSGGKAQEVMFHIKRALEVCGKAQELSNNHDPYSAFGIASCLFECGRYDLAKEIFDSITSGSLLDHELYLHASLSSAHCSLMLNVANADMCWASLKDSITFLSQNPTALEADAFLLNICRCLYVCAHSSHDMALLEKSVELLCSMAASVDSEFNLIACLILKADILSHSNQIDASKDILAQATAKLDILAARSDLPELIAHMIPSKAQRCQKFIIKGSLQQSHTEAESRQRFMDQVRAMRSQDEQLQDAVHSEPEVDLGERKRLNELAKNALLESHQESIGDECSHTRPSCRSPRKSAASRLSEEFVLSSSSSDEAK